MVTLHWGVIVGFAVTMFVVGYAYGLMSDIHRI